MRYRSHSRRLGRPNTFDRELQRNKDAKGFSPAVAFVQTPNRLNWPGNVRQ